MSIRKFQYLLLCLIAVTHKFTETPMIFVDLLLFFFCISIFSTYNGMIFLQNNIKLNVHFSIYKFVEKAPIKSIRKLDRKYFKKFIGKIKKNVIPIWRWSTSSNNEKCKSLYNFFFLFLERFSQPILVEASILRSFFSSSSSRYK